MTPRCAVQSVLLVLLRLAYSTPLCNNQCCRFVEEFPARLTRLRNDFSQIRDYYEANDDLDRALLDVTIEDSFKSPFGCHVMDNVLSFYLRTVLPTALDRVTEENKDLKEHMVSIQHIFHKLKGDVIKCRHYFACKEPFDISNLNSTYTQMHDKGLYKAMGELDILFNYIETYLASNRHASA